MVFNSPLCPRLRTIALALSLSLSACQASPPSRTTTPPPKPPRTIATLLPLTGPLAPQGASMEATARLAVDRINQCDGVRGRQLELRVADSHGEPSQIAATMTEWAAIEGLLGVVEAHASAGSQATAAIAVQQQILQLSASTPSPQDTAAARTGQFQDFWFRLVPRNALQGSALAQVAQKRGFKTVSLLAVQTDQGRELAQAFIDTFTAQGGILTPKGQPSFYDPDTLRWDAPVTEAFASQPEAVVLLADANTGRSLLQALADQGLLGQVPLLVTDAVTAEDLMELGAKTPQGQSRMAGSLGLVPPTPGPGFQQFAALYRQAYDREPQLDDAQVWDGVTLLALAAQRRNSTLGGEIKTQVVPVASPPGIEVLDICQAIALGGEDQELDYQGASSALDFNGWGEVGQTYGVWQMTESGASGIVDTVTVPE